MNRQQQAPGTRSEHAGATFFKRKGNKNLSYHQQRVYNLLMSGGQYSTADISVALHLSDPRSVIRDLRNYGAPVSDVWCTSTFGRRFKRYFVRKEVRDE